jgi:hypothetical protein
MAVSPLMFAMVLTSAAGDMAAVIAAEDAMQLLIESAEGDIAAASEDGAKLSPGAWDAVAVADFNIAAAKPD